VLTWKNQDTSNTLNEKKRQRGVQAQLRRKLQAQHRPSYSVVKNYHFFLKGARRTAYAH
jgi:DNA-binding ferritin-like protein